MMSKELNITDALLWRYAVKKYDKSKKIKSEDFEIIKKSIRYSPSSIGIQPYKVLIIEDEEVRLKLREASGNQSQITDCSHLIVFCTYKSIDKIYVDEMIKGIAHKRGQDVSEIDGLKRSLLNATQLEEGKSILSWNIKQSYIALGFCIETAALLGLDSTPMEGFDIKKYNEILDLENKNLTATVVCCFGYRSDEDKYSKLKKWRKKEEQLFEII